MEMKDSIDKQAAKDVLLALLREYYSRSQHYENQRSAVSSLIVVVAGAILAFVTSDDSLTIADLPLTGLLIVIGLFGAASCIKYHERTSRFYNRGRAVTNKIDEELFNSNLIKPLIDEANKQHAKEFPLLGRKEPSWIQVNRFWIIFHLFLAVLGLILALLTLRIGN